MRNVVSQRDQHDLMKTHGKRAGQVVQTDLNTSHDLRSKCSRREQAQTIKTSPFCYFRRF